jgi:hypothetical protein
MAKGWKRESTRHGMARRGIKTSQYRRKTFKNPENRQERVETVWNVDRLLTKLDYFEIESEDAGMDLDNHTLEYYMEKGTVKQKLTAEAIQKMEISIDNEVKRIESMYGYHGTIAVLETLSTKHTYIDGYLLQYEEKHKRDEEVVSVEDRNVLSKRFEVKINSKGNIKRNKK